MTSSVNPNNINGQYPIAGQDNDSQGFRDNFTNIKNNFTFAKSEIEDLQNKAILKTALSGSTLNNDLNYAQLVSAQLLKTVETKNNLGTQSGSLTISWADGHFQYFTTNGSVSLGFTGWPTNSQYTRMRLEITTDGSARTITFPAAVSVGLSDIQGATGQNLLLAANSTYLFELSTYNNGTTITIQDLLRNYDNLSANTSFSSITIGGDATISGDTLIEGNLRAITKTYEVTVDDDGSSSQEVFFLDGVKLKSNAGALLGLNFAVGETYRFDVSDSTNGAAPLRFATAPDTTVDTSYESTYEFTDKVVFSGNAGNAGAYVDITITNDTPSPLYLYAHEANAAIDTSKIGGEYPIIINGKGAVLSKNYEVPANVSGVFTADVSTANVAFSLPVNPGKGQTVTIVDNGNAAGNKIITVHAKGNLSINGSVGNLTVNQAYGSMTLVSDGTNWATTDYRNFLTTSGNVTATGGLTVTGPTTLTGNVAAASVTGNVNANYLNATTGVTSNAIRVTSATGKLGYNAGSTVGQGSGSGKNTDVTLNAVTGTITMDGGICLGNGRTANTFTLTNSVIEAQDLILVQHQSIGSLGAYVFAATPSSGSAVINVRNCGNVDLSEAIVLRFAVIKSSNS